MSQVTSTLSITFVGLIYYNHIIIMKYYSLEYIGFNWKFVSNNGGSFRIVLIQLVERQLVLCRFNFIVFAFEVLINRSS